MEKVSPKSTLRKKRDGTLNMPILEKMVKEEVGNVINHVRKEKLVTNAKIMFDTLQTEEAEMKNNKERERRLFYNINSDIFHDTDYEERDDYLNNWEKLRLEEQDQKSEERQFKCNFFKSSNQFIKRISPTHEYSQEWREREEKYEKMMNDKKEKDQIKKERGNARGGKSRPIHELSKKFAHQEEKLSDEKSQSELNLSELDSSEEELRQIMLDEEEDYKRNMCGPILPFKEQMKILMNKHSKENKSMNNKNDIDTLEILKSSNGRSHSKGEHSSGKSTINHNSLNNNERESNNLSRNQNNSSQRTRISEIEYVRIDGLIDWRSGF